MKKLRSDKFQIITNNLNKSIYIDNKYITFILN